MSDAPSAPRRFPGLAAGVAAGIFALAALAGTAWLLLVGSGAVARSDLKIGVALILHALAMLAWAGAGLFSAVRIWRLVCAARRVHEGVGGRGALDGWPGLGEQKDRVVVRSGRAALRFWVLPIGLALSAYAYRWLGSEKFNPAELVISLTPAVVAALLAGAWGPSGWKLVLDSARQSLALERYGPFRRIVDASASLPTIQAVRFTDIGRGRGLLTVGLTRGLDWQLDLPVDWPPELGRALAARLAHLAGVEDGNPEPTAVPVTAAAVEERRV